MDLQSRLSSNESAFASASTVHNENGIEVMVLRFRHLTYDLAFRGNSPTAVTAATQVVTDEMVRRGVPLDSMTRVFLWLLRCNGIDVNIAHDAETGPLAAKRW